MNYDEMKRQHEENMARIWQAMAQMPDPATRLASTVDYLTAERDEWRRRALAAEVTSFDIAAQAGLDAQNQREELTAMRQRAEAAEKLAEDRQKHNEWLRSVRATERMQAWSVQERAAELEAKLERVEEYAEYCIAAGGASEYFASFADWLAQQSEVQS